MTLLPPNATDLERALEKTTSNIDDIDVLIDTLWDPWTCPAAFLPWLAWSFSVDTWDPAWPEMVKRQVIDESYEVHRRKGTRGAVKRALKALNLDPVNIIEWFEKNEPGLPYTFEIEFGSGGGLSADDQDKIYQTVMATKNVRSHLADIRHVVEPASALGITCAASAYTVTDAVLDCAGTSAISHAALSGVTCVFRAATIDMRID
ncbi:phage tail protein I [Thalassospira sp. TSL5-1]|uniref:phage tail protein I n=1 Tax=Thalassospira sp. TSL5-1 TaxID=1544451 RepID=UPI00093D1D10|nr:phage tail protein I [Thalassospira sp. TSL5-1]